MRNRFILSCVAIGCFMFSSLCFSQTYSVSSKVYKSSWPTHDWNGSIQLPNVYCVMMPKPADALNMTEAMFNGNTISLARVSYPNEVSIYVATSVIPLGRTAEDEVGRMRESNRQSALAQPDNISVSDMTTSFGSTTDLIIKNVFESTPQGPFPLVRGIAKFPNDTLMSISVHRLFVHGPDRIEVAGLKYFRPPAKVADEPSPLADLTVLVDSVVDSLQRCTSKMPTGRSIER